MRKTNRNLARIKVVKIAMGLLVAQILLIAFHVVFALWPWRQASESDVITISFKVDEAKRDSNPRARDPLFIYHDSERYLYRLPEHYVQYTDSNVSGMAVGKLLSEEYVTIKYRKATFGMHNHIVDIRGKYAVYYTIDDFNEYADFQTTGLNVLFAIGEVLFLLCGIAYISYDFGKAKFFSKKRRRKSKKVNSETQETKR